MLLFNTCFMKANYLQQGENEKEFFPNYYGNDLGLTWSAQQSAFRIWAPVADKAQLKLYDQCTGGKILQTIELEKAEQGTWVATIPGNQEGLYYTFCIEYNDEWLDDVPDPYAKTTGTNGKRAMIIDLKKTDPDDWANDQSRPLKNPTDAIIYELQVRDASINANSGINCKGKFLGLTETGTKNNEGFATGIDHLIELGVTHIHLLPFFDFNSVDESDTVNTQYNWGYNPLNYNSPEGSYATNAEDGSVRIKELKQLIKTFHDNGLAVVMDVVYNHTALTEHSYFNQLVPGYYYRKTKEGAFSNATACGNETASEKEMMRMFMLQSVLYWVTEYHIDGFRFDLMGVHDIETMNIISAAVHKIKPGILLYGEGWAPGSSTLPETVLAVKKNSALLNDIAVFSDELRDGIKGSVFDGASKGFVSNNPGMEESVKFGIVAACEHPHVNYSRVNYSKVPYAKAPGNIINYADCHDNHTLWDKLCICAASATNEEKISMHKLALSIVLTSQGIPFLHAGTEFLRSKKGIENSYNSPDSINAIDWSLKTKNREVFSYVQQLIKMRKEHPAFTLQTAAQIKDSLLFFKTASGVIGYQINGTAVKDNWQQIQVWFNGSNVENTIAQPTTTIFKKAIENNFFVVPEPADILILQPYSCTLIYRG